jgi:HEPN domain-containing protein
MDTKTKYWLELAEYDLETAQAMLECQRFIYVGFMCHQSIEKVLKAYWQQTFDTMPPKTHNLAFLIEKSNLLSMVPAPLNDIIDELDPLNIQCRYPEYKDKIYRVMNADYSLKILISTRELFTWLKQKLS